MSWTSRWIAAAPLALMLVGSGLQAQEAEFGVQGGLQIPMGDLGTTLDHSMGYVFGAHLGLYYGDGHEFRPRVDYQSYNGHYDSTGQKTDVSAWSLGADYVYYTEQRRKGLYLTMGASIQLLGRRPRRQQEWCGSGRWCRLPPGPVLVLRGALHHGPVPLRQRPSQRPSGCGIVPLLIIPPPGAVPSPGLRRAAVICRSAPGGTRSTNMGSARLCTHLKSPAPGQSVEMSRSFGILSNRMAGFWPARTPSTPLRFP